MWRQGVSLEDLVRLYGAELRQHITHTGAGARQTHAPLNTGQIVINHTHQGIEAVVDAMNRTDGAGASLREPPLRGRLNGPMGAA